MFWTNFSSTLLAIILLIAVGERCLHAGGTGDGHVGPSDDPSQVFWTNTEEISIPELDRELVVNLRMPQVRGDLPDHYQRCQGAMAQVTGSDGHPFTAIVTQYSCWQDMQRVPNHVDKAITDGGTEVSFQTPPSTSQARYPHFAVFKVTNPGRLRAVPLAKPNMPRDNTVKGITATRSGAKIFDVATSQDCLTRFLPHAYYLFCASTPNGVAVDAGIAAGSPFFVKSSGTIYLAGFHVMFETPVPNSANFRGAHIYREVNEETVWE